jgi:predicted transcriptional regulator
LTRVDNLVVDLNERRRRSEGMPKELPNLGPAELDILRTLWERGASTAREIREAIESHRPLAHASVATILNRLHQKGLVVYRKGDRGKAFLYEARHELEHVQSSAVKKFVRRIFAGDAVSLVSALVESESLTPDQFRRLREMLDRIETTQRTASRKRS